MFLTTSWHHPRPLRIPRFLSLLFKSLINVSKLSVLGRIAAAIAASLRSLYPFPFFPSNLHNFVMKLPILLSSHFLVLLFLAALVLSTEDYYKLLGLDKDASDRQLKKAYRTLSKKFHPDKNPYVP